MIPLASPVASGGDVAAESNLGVLEREASLVPLVSVQAADEYGARRADLVRRVNRLMEQEPDLERLVGRDRDAMRDNHKNHGDFLYNILRFGQHRLLARTLPWVYRVYSERGFADAYFPVELQHWKRALVELLSPSAARAILPVYDWMLSAHARVLIEAQRPTGVVAATDETWVQPQVVFSHCVLEGNHRGALGLAQSLVHTVDDYGRFCVSVVQPALQEVGRLWETGRATVAQEHMATELSRRVVAELHARFRPDSLRPGRVLVSASANEHHDFGARMVANLLELDGWETRFLGADQPTDSLVGLCEAFRPTILAVSLCMALHADRLAELVAACRARPALAGLRIMAGGRLFNESPGFRDIPGIDGWAPDALEAVRLARTWA